MMLTNTINVAIVGPRNGQAATVGHSAVRQSHVRRWDRESVGVSEARSSIIASASRQQGLATDSLWELLSSPDPGPANLFGGGAPSATDAHTKNKQIFSEGALQVQQMLTFFEGKLRSPPLRPAGHLKEQDYLIDYMRRMHETHTCEEVMLKMERWIQEHIQDSKRSRLVRLIPRIGTFQKPLKLVEAFKEYDRVFALSRRKYIAPNFAELRHIVNIAHVHAVAESLKLITFDADGTLYADGHHFEQDNAMISIIISLMRRNVAIVTAAGYPGEAGLIS
eukprot:gene14649-20683_t